MKKHGRTLMAMTMAVAMATATIGSMVPANGITAEAASIKLSKTSLKMKVGQSMQLKVKGTKKTVKWSVSNGKIVKVTKKGKVTAKKVGSAKVYAKVKGKKLTCKVKVTASENAKATATPSIGPTATATAAPVSTMTGNTSSGSSSSSSSNSSSKATGTPKVTSTPNPSATSGASITPTATNEAEKTEQPENTKKPGKTDAPDETKAPSESENPDATKGPKETKTPSESEAPDATKGPKETKEPSESEDPKETKAPEETETPDATDAPAQGDATEIKVGDTKTATVDGVKFTYTATKSQVIIKMENNSKIAKKISGSVDLLNEKGAVLNEDSFLYGFDIDYLEAGQTHYDYVYNYFEQEELNSYSVKNVEVGAVASYNVGCIKDIKATPDKGTDVENPEITLEYTGDTSALNGKNIWVYGSIVYYDSEDNIVDVWGIYDFIEVSAENSTVVVNGLGTFSDEAVRYEIVLSGASYVDYDDYDDYDEEY